MSEAEAVLKQEAGLDDSLSLYTAFNQVPYALINKEVEETGQDYSEELVQICKFYKAYYKGVKFLAEGSHNDYVPADLRYKLSANLINKEARFLFAETPDITIKQKGNVEDPTQETKDMVNKYNTFLKAVLDANNFADALVKSAKDCFIGKRVAGLINFNEEDGVSISFLPSTHFVYETKGSDKNVITKFVCFQVVTESKSSKYKRIFRKKYWLDDNGTVMLQEDMFDGMGRLVEEITPETAILLKRIPVAIFINDGLTGDDKGLSDVEQVMQFERWYSRQSNAAVDAERKSMNPTIYAIDMSVKSTKNLSRGPGSFWDLQSEQNNDNSSPGVGILEPAMNYSGPLKETLERIKAAGYEALDIPMINLETMVGSITSGKALKSIYWPLIVRCKEKMKMWGPQLQTMVEHILEGAAVYPNCITKYIEGTLTPIAYEITIEQNIPLPEDENEQRTLDLAEVDSKVLSRKAYMKKWHGLSDGEVEQELEQIARERELLEDAAFTGATADEPPYPDSDSDDVDNIADEGVEQVQA